MHQPGLDHGSATITIGQTIQVIHYEYMKKGKDLPIVIIPERLHFITFIKYYLLYHLFWATNVQKHIPN